MYLAQPREEVGEDGDERDRHHGAEKRDGELTDLLQD